MQRAREVFIERGLTNTRDRNGILLYVQVRQHDFVVLADEGINGKIEPGYWQNVCDSVLACFRQKKMTLGILVGVMMAGDCLARFSLIEKSFARTVC